MSTDLGGFSMHSIFRDELATQATILAGGLDRLPGAGSEDVGRLVRAANAIASAARIVALEAGAEVAEGLEQSLAAVRDGLVPTDSDVASLRSALGFLEELGAVDEGALPAWIVAHRSPLEATLEGLRTLRLRARPAPPVETTSSPSDRDADRAPTSAGGDESSGDHSLLELFRLELESHSGVLGDGLVALAGEGGAQGIDPLMRAAHSLKGAARIIGFDPVVKLAHAMEDVLSAAGAGRRRLSGQHIDLLLRANDALRDLAQLSVGEYEGAMAARRASMLALERAVVASASPDWEGGPEREKGTEPAPDPQVREEGVPALDSERSAQVAGARYVRLSSEQITAMMGLCGEVLVETRALKPAADALLALRNRQQSLCDQVADIRRALGRSGDARTGQHLRQLEDDLRRSESELHEQQRAIDHLAAHTDLLATRLYDSVLRSRMRPFADRSRGLRRLVHDVTRALGKKARLEIRGEQTEVDRDILVALEAPLHHIVRNAIDHGLEAPAARLASGKPETGHILIEACHRGGRLLVAVTDDGRGVDRDRVRARALERGLTSAAMIADMGDDELLAFLFLPGFSTVSQVTEISGRGVGLDVVQTMVQETGGNLIASSQPGQGTSFRIELPVTRSVIRALVVEVAREPFAFPLARIDRALTVARERVQMVEDRQYLDVDGDAVGLVDAHQVLEPRGATTPGNDINVVVLRKGARRYGISVDRFLGERELVVQPLDARLGKLADIDAVAAMPDGFPVLVIDVDDLVRSIESLVTAHRPEKVRTAADDPSRRKRVLIVDDSITVREVERKLLENRGYSVSVAVDGVDGWNTVRGGDFDLVITDVDMPRETGIELTARIKADVRLRATPVMIVSYKDREEDRLAGLAAGADYYLPKSSFHDDQLVSAVVDLIGAAREV